VSEPTHKSQSQMRTSVTDSFRENYDRIHGENHKPTRGKWVYTSSGEAVPVEEYRSPTETDVHTQISTDRHYENIAATDGTDIGSRRKRAEYMKRHNLADASDFSETWKRAAAEREKYLKAEVVPRSLRETVGRAEYELSKRKRGKR
jgi:hypothetical protein